MFHIPLLSRWYLKLSNAYRRIALFLQSVNKGTGELWMRVDYIAWRANCSVRTVQRFFASQTVIERKFRKEKGEYQQSNEYTFFEGLCDAISWLCSKGLQFAHRSRADEIADSYREKSKMSPLKPKNVTQIKTSLNSSVSKETGTIPLPLSKGDVPKNAQKGTKMTEWQMSRLMELYTDRERFEAKKDYEWYKKKHEVYNTYGFYKKQCEYHRLRK